MKIWQGFGSEHSANLVIIGHFKSPVDAKSTKDLIETAIGIATEDERAGRIVAGRVPDEFSPAMLEFLSKNNQGFTYADAESLLYDFRIDQDGADVVITTDDQTINGLMTMLVDKGAKVEVYSAHMHPGNYGRQTHEG